MSAKFGHHPWMVEELVSGIDKGTIRLPDIQRPFVWPNAKVRDLIDSMYRGYPVGELMFWANKGDEHTSAIGAETGGRVDDHRPSHLTAPKSHRVRLNHVRRQRCGDRAQRRRLLELAIKACR
jgi:hypothetical protein